MGTDLRITEDAADHIRARQNAEASDESCFEGCLGLTKEYQSGEGKGEASTSKRPKTLR
jgi:hypothetical protein